MVTQNKKIINVGISPKLSQPCWVALSLSFSLLLLGSVLKSQILLLFSGFSDLFIFCFFMLCFFFVYFILFGAVILQLGFEDNVPFLQCRGFFDWFDIPLQTFSASKVRVSAIWTIISDNSEQVLPFGPFPMFFFVCMFQLWFHFATICPVSQLSGLLCLFWWDSIIPNSTFFFVSVNLTRIASLFFFFLYLKMGSQIFFLFMRSSCCFC